MVITGIADAQRPTTQIVVFDQAGVSEPVLREASKVAREIFHSAGVESKWTACRVFADAEEHCRLPEGKNYIKVLLRQNGIGLQKTDEGIGLAVIVKGEPRVLCYAFVEPAEAMANASQVAFAIVLAAVMAHEVGHLMGLEHSPSGIMKPKLQRHEIIEAGSGRLLFDSRQATALRASIRRMVN